MLARRCFNILFGAMSLSALTLLAIDPAAQARTRKPVYDYNQPKGGCTKFGWPLARELQWFGGGNLPVYESGAKRDTPPDNAFTLDLDADNDATLVMPLERKSRNDNGYGGSISFGPLPRGGLYQITLSEDGLVDIIQNGHYLKKKASHMRRDCPAVRRSIRVELTAAPLVLQFGGVEMPSLTIAVAPAE
ncbi:MAG: hypothetical protein ACTHLY_15565 [Pseudolabrys sp.]